MFCFADMGQFSKLGVSLRVEGLGVQGFRGLGVSGFRGLGVRD